MARKVRVVDNDINIFEKLNGNINSTGHKKWILFALILLLIIIAAIIVPPLLTIIQRHSMETASVLKTITNAKEITQTTSTETIVLTISTAGEKDKILEIVEKLTEQNDNPCTTYLIEEFNDKVTFGKLLSKPEIIGELRKIFHDMKPTSDINITNAIESFRKIPWSSQITNILFVPDEAMYRNQEIYESDMKSAKDLLKQMAIENPISAPRIVIGNPVYFQDIHSSVRAYSSDMNVDKLTEAILLALQDEESKMPEIFTSTISNKEDATLPSSIAETLSTTSWIRDTTQEQKISTLVDKNIDPTPVSSDLSGTIECTTIRTFVSYSIAESVANLYQE